MVLRRSFVWSLIGVLLSSWLFGSFAATPALAAGGSATPQVVKNDPDNLAYLYRSEEAVQTYVAPPAPSPYLRAQTATISVEYNDFPPNAQAAFQAAVDIWQTLLTSPVPIEVVAYWQPLGQNVLGGAESISAADNFDGAPQPDTFYPSALANKLAGHDLAPEQSDIKAIFNSNEPDWYFGTGQTPPAKLSFVSTVLHELTHGLGFVGSATVSGGSGRWGGIQGLPRVYDRNVVNGAGTNLVDTDQFPNPSTALAQQLQSNDLFWGGAGGVAANNGTRPKLFAPSTWQQGSSYSHLDELTYPAGSPNALMTPAMATGETIYDPGPIVLGIFSDMGWTATGNPGQSCFPETGKCIKGRFAQYWKANGGLAQQGFPITDEFQEVNPTDGKTYTTQYFERARFELHPENQAPYDVLLGLLGREQLQAKYGDNIPAPASPNPLGAPCATFAQTSKQVCGDFLDYWAAHGGLAQQGFPLTDLFMETNPTDGKQYPTQYFERARFEYHAEYAGTPYAVLLGLLGREQFLAKYPHGIPSGPSPSPSPSPLPQANALPSLTPDQGPTSTHVAATGFEYTTSTHYAQVTPQGGMNFGGATASRIPAGW